MKKTLIAFMIIALFFIGLSYASSQEQPSAAQVNETEIKYGKVLLEDVFTGSPDWKVKADEYQPQPSAITFLANVAVPVKIEIYFGHWCSDSVNNIPKFLKIMELAANPAFEMEFWSVEKMKKGEKRGPVNNRTLKAIPTFVVFAEDKEIGEIIENPTISVEEDLVNILRTIVNQ